jgi:ArsR family transcriptional regulator
LRLKNIFANTTISLANIFVNAYKQIMAGKSSPFNMERFFQALGDNTRLRLLNLMGDQEICVCYFVEILEQGQPKISRHLAYLRRAGIVEARRDGKWMHYRIVMPPNIGAAQVLRQTLGWLKEERAMQADRTRLSKACCSPAKFAALQGAPLPLPVDCSIASEAR